MSNETNNIDYSIWVTQADLARQLGVKTQCVHNWIKRNKIQAKEVKHLSIVLVDKTSVTARHYNKPK